MKYAASFLAHKLFEVAIFWSKSAHRVNNETSVMYLFDTSTWTLHIRQAFYNWVADARRSFYLSNLCVFHG